MTEMAAEIAEAFVCACAAELEAPKPGNVHHFADGHRMSADDFLRSAAAAAGPLTQAGAPIGMRILNAVEATFAAVGTNTNLGIVLLCAPLAAATERDNPDLRAALAEVLATLDRDDADRAFRAIRRASPAGLGRAERYDVFAPVTATLREAMAEAAGRDRIARQYVSDFEDVFALGAPVLARALMRAPHPRWATLAVYLTFLSTFPDSHIVRKHGAATAAETQQSAVAYLARLTACDAPDHLLPDLLTWDAALKSAGINPGTSADLTVATLFASRLGKFLRPASRSG